MDLPSFESQCRGLLLNEKSWSHLYDHYISIIQSSISPYMHYRDPILPTHAAFHTESCKIYLIQVLLLRSKHSSLKHVFLKFSGTERGEQGPQHTFRTFPAFSPCREPLHLHVIPALRSRAVPVLPPEQGCSCQHAHCLTNPSCRSTYTGRFYFGEKSVPAWQVPPSK